MRTYHYYIIYIWTVKGCSRWQKPMKATGHNDNTIKKNDDVWSPNRNIVKICFRINEITMILSYQFSQWPLQDIGKNACCKLCLFRVKIFLTVNDGNVGLVGVKNGSKIVSVSPISLDHKVMSLGWGARDPSLIHMSADIQADQLALSHKAAHAGNAWYVQTKIPLCVRFTVVVKAFGAHRTTRRK